MKELKELSTSKIEKSNFTEEKLKDFLWRKRELVEEIAPEYIAKYNKLIINGGRISIIVSITLSAFFKNAIEGNFYKVRFHNRWKEFVGFKENIGCPYDVEILCNKVEKDEKKTFIYDKEEREKEEKCYILE